MPTKPLLLLTAALAAILTLLTAPAAEAEPLPRETVIIVPGQSFGAVPYTFLKQGLETAGYRVEVLNTPGLNLTADAHVIARAVDAAHATAGPGARVSLVGHSVGGLSARYYLKFLGGAPKVANYIAIGTSQYGNPSACRQSGTARDVCLGSPFLTRLNKGVNAVGPTSFYSIRSAQEWADGRLTGKQCRLIVPSRTGNGGLDHTLEPIDPNVRTATLSALSGRCTGTSADEPADSIAASRTLFPAGH